MKHWLFLRAGSRPPDWERISDSINLTSYTVRLDEGIDYIVPVNKTLLPDIHQQYVPGGYNGQTLTQFDKDTTALAVLNHKNVATITQSYIPEVLRDEYNSRIIDLDLIERILDKKDWCALGLLVEGDDSITQNALLQDSRYIVRDNQYRLAYADTNELCDVGSPTKSLLLFVAYKLGRTNAYILAVNPNILSLNGQLGGVNDQRSITATTSSPNIVSKFALMPKINCSLVNNAIVVNRGELEIAVGRNTIVYYKVHEIISDLDFTVECSWDYTIVDNIIKIKKQAGVGYIKIITPWVDMAKPYITAEDRKITLEYILLGV